MIFKHNTLVGMATKNSLSSFVLDGHLTDRQNVLVCLLVRPFSKSNESTVTRGIIATRLMLFFCDVTMTRKLPIIIIY